MTVWASLSRPGKTLRNSAKWPRDAWIREEPGWIAGTTERTKPTGIRELVSGARHAQCDRPETATHGLGLSDGLVEGRGTGRHLGHAEGSLAHDVANDGRRDAEGANLRRRVEGNASNGHQRNRRPTGKVGRTGEPIKPYDGLRIGLGRRRKDGTVGDVVRAQRQGFGKLLEAVSREAYPQARGQAAHMMDRHVALPDVHAVAARQGSKIGTIVGKQRNPARRQ